jgi:hypothetical protein
MENRLMRKQACMLLSLGVLLPAMVWDNRSAAGDSRPAPSASAATPPVASGSAAPPPARYVGLWDVTDEDVSAKDKFGLEVHIIGDPVHETLTVHALANAALLPTPDRTAKAAVQYLRGVFWNDDPCADLFFDKKTLIPSTGFTWYADFRAADHESDPKKFENLTCRLLGRSHFGDLQFLHGMASADGVDAATTRTAMLAWAKYTYRIAIGELKANQTLVGQQAPITGVAPGMDAMTLFAAPNIPAVPGRAIASLVHMLQDSYAAGHTRRESDGHGGLGALVQFHSYAHQNHAKHKADDMWRTGGNDIEKIKGVVGGPEALAASTQIFKLYKAKKPWADVESYLSNGPLQLANKPLLSGP